jgi:endonuclease/exonuclease/phosphatase family metal-dependent hydrolase
MEEHNLVSIDTAFRPLIGHTYERDDGQSTSWPDHFLTNSAFASNFKVVKSLKLGAYLSDHHPLCADIILGTPPRASISNKKKLGPLTRR